MQNLLNSLGKDIKPQGKNRWIARCPVHNDKDFAMSIKEATDGSVIAYCHACGANGLDLYIHLSLDLKELFGGRDNPNPIINTTMRDNYDTDRLIKKMVKTSVENGEQLSYADFKRNRLAIARTKGIDALERGERSESTPYGKTYKKKSNDGLLPRF